MENQNSLVIKIKKDSHGNDVSLSNMPLEVTEALVLFIQNLVGFAKLNIHTDTNDVHISIRNGCIQGEMVYPSTRSDIDLKITSIVNSESEENDLIKYFKAIQDKVKQNGLEYAIILNQNGRSTDLTSKFKNKRFPLKRGARSEWSKEINFINGKLFNAGGRITSNIHIDIADEPIKIDCTKKQAKAVNNFLYEDTYLCVETKIKSGVPKYHTMIDYYTRPEMLAEYKQFYEDIIEKNYEERYLFFHDFVFSIMSNNEKEVALKKLRKYIRLLNNDNFEAGMLRTILVSLKVFKNDPILSEELENIASRLRTLTGKTKI